MEFIDHVQAALLMSLRIAPVFAFAPPFTLIRIPNSAKAFLSLALAAWLVHASPPALPLAENAWGIARIAGAEVLVGMMIALVLQIAFAALVFAGKAIDIQAGFGLAGLADPTLRTQMPLLGTLFAYGAGAVFFALDGPLELLRIWSFSVEVYPLGQFSIDGQVGGLLEYLAAVFVIAIAAAGLVLLTLFLIDLTVALLSRTLPQMNVLLLGFQVKTIAVLMVLPLVFSVSGSMLLRVLRVAITSTPGVLTGA